MSFDHVVDPMTREYLANGTGDPVNELDKAWNAFAGDEEDERVEFDTLDKREEALNDAELAPRNNNHAGVRAACTRSGRCSRSPQELPRTVPTPGRPRARSDACHTQSSAPMDRSGSD